MSANHIRKSKNAGRPETAKFSDEQTELFSRKVHEKWVEKHINSGWIYGPRVDLKEKRHPCLVPYDELPEFEKKIYRATAISIMGSSDEYE